VSLLVTTDVECDHPGCLAWTAGETAHGRTLAKIARQRAKANGWTYRDGKDLCPEHDGSDR
jgi:hypothetical protein